MCNDRDKHGGTRRSFLRAAGLAGAGAAALGAGAGGLLDSQPALAAINPKSLGGGSWNPDVESPRFTVAVMPDTQFLYFAPSIMPEPQLASFRYIVDQASGGNGNIVFMAHLGDLTEDGLATRFGRPGGRCSTTSTSAGRPAAVLAAGNTTCSAPPIALTSAVSKPPWDRSGSRSQRRSSAPTPPAITPRTSSRAAAAVAAARAGLADVARGFAWANGIIKQYPALPVILTTHEIAGPTYDDSVYPYQSGDAEDNASLSAYGQQLWDGLINDNDQIFLTLNGHYWPPGRTVLTNAAGNDVHVHITNYQNRYYGGAAMIRLYHFDLELNTIEVETIAPYFLEQPAEERNLLAADLAELTTTVDRFSVPIDFAQRFSGFDHHGPLARARVRPGTLAWPGSTRARRDGVPPPRCCPTCPATATT